MATALSIPLTPLPFSDSSSAGPPGSAMLECTSSVLRIATIPRLSLTRPLRITTCWFLATLLLLLQNDWMVREGMAVGKPPSFHGRDAAASANSYQPLRPYAEG